MLFLASTLSYTSAAMWIAPLSRMGLARNATDAVTTPASTASDSPTTATVDEAAKKSCLDQIGKVENGVVMNTMPKYDVAKVGAGAVSGREV